MSENGEWGHGAGRIMRPMTLDADACYRALSAHDVRFDGRFFVGVSSTRIYCRPVCSVRMPRRENCRFFPSAAAAEVAGYRPCLRCRPELAPGHASVDASERLARGAVSLIEDGVLDDGGIEHLADRVGVTSRHLRRIFESQYGVSPIEYAQTHRLLLAKRLLTDTSLPVTDVALASGFASVRRFNALFRARYRMAPGRLRVHAGGAALPRTLAFELAYRPPYDWEGMLDFLRARAVTGVEHVGPDSYARSLAVPHRGTIHKGSIAVRKARRKHALAIAVSPSLARAVPAVLSRVKHAFDLACDPAVVAAALGELAAARPGLRVPGACDGFELAVRAVVGQQISVRGARTLLSRLAATFGERIPEAPAEIAYLFPAAVDIAAIEPAAIARIGMPLARARTVVALARAVAAGEVALQPEGDVEATIERLLAVPGIGTWTANYIAMRALRWPDAFLEGDLIVRRALDVARPAQALARAEAWQPWRAYAVIHLWRSQS